MEIKKAVRHAVPQIISIAGVSGSGKTFSALLLAAGLAGPSGKVGFLDTENGRGCMYSDSPGIRAALPQGYDVIEMSAPFAPSRYIEAIDEFEKRGYSVLVIDSGSHEWEGYGGCTDIAEKDKGRWNNAKLANKRFVARLLSSNMHVIVCLRAREKSKIIPAGGGKKEEVISLGVQPICEKNFPFEMLLSFLVEEKTHFATALKCPQMLMPLFEKPVLLTKESGEKIRQWNDTGAIFDSTEQLIRESRAAADKGMAAYQEFFKSLSAANRKALGSTHEDNKRAAAAADELTQAATNDLEDREEFPDAMAFDAEAVIKVRGELFRPNADRSAWEPVGEAQAA